MKPFRCRGRILLVHEAVWRFGSKTDIMVVEVVMEVAIRVEAPSQGKSICLPRHCFYLFLRLCTLGSFSYVSTQIKQHPSNPIILTYKLI